MAILAVLAVTTVVLSWTAEVGACSIGNRVGVQYLDKLDDMDVVAIGQPEIVARTGAASGWHRAGVIAFTSAWLVGGDEETVAETVWTMNDGRTEQEGFCNFRFDADTVGTRQGFRVLMANGAVLPLALAFSPDSGSLDAAPVDPSVLTDRYGPPVEITPDPGLVEAAYAPLAAERRADDVSLQATLGGSIVVLVLALPVARTRRSPTRRPLEPA